MKLFLFFPLKHKQFFFFLKKKKKNTGWDAVLKNKKIKEAKIKTIEDENP